MNKSLYVRMAPYKGHCYLVRTSLTPPPPLCADDAVIMEITHKGLLVGGLYTYCIAVESK